MFPTGRPGVLYDGLLAPLVSSVEYLMNGWMSGLCTFKIISFKLWVLCGVAEVYSMSCLLVQFYLLIQFSLWLLGV